MKPQQPPKRYARQAKGRTIISASISAEVAEWMRQQADAQGMTVSTWLNTQIKARMALEPPAAKVHRLNETPTAYQATPRK